MWQAIHYNDAMFSSTQPGNALFGTPSGLVDQDSPLKPFKHVNGSYLTSRAVASTRSFGYTYPEIRDWALEGADLARAVRNEVNRLYSGGSPAASSRRPEPFNSKQNASPLQVLRDYSLDVAVDREDLPLPSSIELRLDNQTVGIFALLAMPPIGTSYATIPIRRTLQDASVKLDVPAAVVNMLKKALTVVVKKVSQEATVCLEQIILVFVRCC